MEKNLHGNYDKKISTEVNLSKKYINHSMRGTLVALLKERMSNSDIQLVTGHKSESSVSRYVRHRIDAVIRSNSIALGKAHEEERAKL